MVNIKKSINYWNNFYKKKNILKPSNFSIFCENFLKKKKYKSKLFDIGCGNGRDTVFFNKKKIDCIGLDISSEVIKINKIKFKNIKKNFSNKDFSIFFKKKINVSFSIYSRFTWHTINDFQEKILLNYLVKQNKLDYIFIETRTIKDDLYNKGTKIGTHEFITSHYRRFINPPELKEKLKKNFKIIYFYQGKNLAKFKNENPYVLRIIAKKIRK